MVALGRRTTAFRPWIVRRWTKLLVAGLALAVPATPQALVHGVVEAVADEQRVPVHEAAVRAFVDDEAIAVAFSDREGRYALEVPAETFELRLVKPGYVARAGGVGRPTLQRTCPAAGDCGQVDFLLERSAAVEVWLTDPSGDPFPGAHLVLTPQGDEREATKNVQTDDRGVRRFYGLVPGRYTLDASSPPLPMGIGRLYEFDSVDLDLRSGENPSVHLSARRATGEVFSLSGVIEGVDFDSTRHWLQIRPLHGGAGRGWGFVQNGPALEVSRLPQGEYVLELTPRGQGGGQPVLLGRMRVDDNVSGLLLKPRPLPNLVIHVEVEDGAPDSVKLALRSDEGWVWGTYQAGRRSQSFSIRDAPPGRYTLTSADPAAFVLDEPVVHLSEGSVEALEITVSARFAAVGGSVRDAGQGPVRVELTGPRGQSLAETGPAGAFLFKKLVPGEYALCAIPPGKECTSGRRRQFSVQAGDEIEIELGAPQ